MKNVKNIITLALLGAFVLGLSGWAAVKPPQAVRERASAAASKSKRVCFIKNPPHICFLE